MMGYSIEVKELPSQLTLQISKQVTFETIPAAMGEAFGAIMAQAEAGGATYAGPPFVIYPGGFEGDFPMVLHMPVAPGAAAPDPASGVELGEVAGGTAACVMHMGPYERLGEAYEAAQTWLQQNGKTPSGPPREIYLNDPGSVGPDELLTEIAFPIA
jgi:AraC family transcriptional regulator